MGLLTNADCPRYNRQCPILCAMSCSILSIIEQGSHLHEKTAFFTQKKSRLLKCRAFTVRKKPQWPHTSKCVWSFRFLHPPEVCRALAVGLNILFLDSPRPHPLPSPSHSGEGMLVPTYCWWRNQKGLFPVWKPARSWPGQILGKLVLIVFSMLCVCYTQFLKSECEPCWN